MQNAAARDFDKVSLLPLAFAAPSVAPGVVGGLLADLALAEGWNYGWKGLTNRSWGDWIQDKTAIPSAVGEFINPGFFTRKGAKMLYDAYTNNWFSNTLNNASKFIRKKVPIINKVYPRDRDWNLMPQYKYVERAEQDLAKVRDISQVLNDA
jgi:hypothetical protein